MPRLSKVFFCSIPELDINYNHTVNFTNINNQINWFLNKAKYVMTECTYLRKERSLTIDKYIDDCMNYNYCLWNNGTRWEYFFIINKEYVTEHSTKFTLKLDVFQTYYFNINFDKIESYIERQHCNRFDTSGNIDLDNLLEPEDLEVGELKVQEIYNAYDYSDKGCYFLTSSTRLGMINGGSSGGSTGRPTGNQTTLYKDGYMSMLGLYFLKQAEGFSPTPYNLGDGTFTIGYGTTSEYDSTHYNQLAPQCTEQQASEVLGDSLYKSYSKYVHDTFVSYGYDMNKMKQNEFDAFVDFYYNTGSLTSRSIFTKYINGDSKESIAEVWKTTVIMSGTQFEQGLRNRRKAEVNVFLNADYNYKKIEILDGSGYITDNNGMGYIPPPYDRQEPSHSTIRENVVASARKLLGKPYVWGGNYPPLGSDKGTDCSGLCQWAYNDNGIKISRTTYTQIQDGKETTYDNLKMGDLVFTRGKTDNGHVVMFISKNSDGSIHVIEAKQTGTDIMENDRTPNDDYRYRSIIND